MRDLESILASGRKLAEEQVVWPTGTRLAITAYVHDELPPPDLVTSARAVLRRGRQLLVFHDHTGEPHVLPGGRREPGETLEETLRREVLEETGWAIGPPRLLACIHLRHLGPKPPGYPYPYPDVLQVVYLADALTHHPACMVADEYVTETRLVPVTEALTLSLNTVERAIVEAALSLWVTEDLPTAMGPTAQRFEEADAG